MVPGHPSPPGRPTLSRTPISMCFLLVHTSSGTETFRHFDMSKHHVRSTYIHYRSLIKLVLLHRMQTSWRSYRTMSTITRFCFFLETTEKTFNNSSYSLLVSTKTLTNIAAAKHKNTLASHDRVVVHLSASVTKNFKKPRGEKLYDV